ncbi:hypothetical protein L3055_11280, partial [Corynebacterium sp. MC-02]|nr:hypothetical protein [Corynebacterium pseudokroppenstedtii]
MDFLSTRRGARNIEEEQPRPSYSENIIGNSLITKIFSKKGRGEENSQLSEIIDVDKDIQTFKQNQLKLLDPKILYKANIFSRTHLLYRHYREEQISALKDNIVNLNLVNLDSMKTIKRTHMTLMHMGLIVIGIKGLARKNLGAKVLIVVYDDRWTDLKKSIIGLTEVDMTHNGGICYISPDFLINLNEFGSHIKIGIQTKGYEEMDKGNNLLVCLGFIGKMASNSSSRFKIKTDDVVELMGNKGIRLIKPIKIDPEEYAGLEWNLEKFNKPKTYSPETHLMYKNRRGETSIRFTDYSYTRQIEEDEETEETETITESTIMNIEILEEGYAVDEVIEKAKNLNEENEGRTFKCR